GIFFCQFVGCTYKLFCCQKAVERGSGIRTERSTLPLEIYILERHAKRSCGIKRVTIITKQHTKLGLANPHSILQHGLEHEFQIARRTRNNSQHLRSRRLLLQRLGKLARALLLGLEQPNVLDRDHRLVGKGADKLNLPVRKRRDLCFPQGYYSEWNALAQQRNR